MMRMRTLPVIFVLLLACSSAAYSQSLTEEFSFQIKDFKMDHQTQTNNLNISISYRYIANIQKPDYPDFRWLAKDVEILLSNYPNKDDNQRARKLIHQGFVLVDKNLAADLRE